MLALIDRDGLVNEGGESRGSTDSSDSVFDFGLQFVVKQETFRAVVKVQRIREGLKIDCVGSGGFGLAKLREFGFGGRTEIAIHVEIAEGLFESRVVVTKGMIVLFWDFTSPGEGGTAEKGDDEENLLFIGTVGVRTHDECECAMGNEIAEIRDFARKLGRCRNFGISGWRAGWRRCWGLRCGTFLFESNKAGEGGSEFGLNTAKFFGGNTLFGEIVEIGGNVRATLEVVGVEGRGPGGGTTLGRHKTLLNVVVEIDESVGVVKEL